MLNPDRIAATVNFYKQHFKDHWLDEKYKWEAAKHFQKNWDINADDFKTMFEEATRQAKNLLTSRNYFPRSMILEFAKVDPESTRSMFLKLFDENTSISDRIDEFMRSAEQMRIKYNDSTWKSHYQTTNSVSTYLWLNFPEKYYIYKYSESRTVTKALETDFRPKKEAKSSSLVGSYKVYDEICEHLGRDNELLELVRSSLTPDCYTDPKYKTLTVDFVFFISRNYSKYEEDVVEVDTGETDDKTDKTYGKERFLKDVYITEENYDTLISLLKNKKNIILQGAPGVGKTFISKRLAYAKMTEKDEDRIKLIQFHLNYSYEDFVMGYKPTNEGFSMKYGIFYEFCKTAESNPNKEYFFIIDEVNRGNMSKIFGELLMLIEKSYRETKATLAYSGEQFSVPENLYIIGLMNTADRSLAMIDYALRRRFSFFELEPGFNSEGFRAYQGGFKNETFDLLVDCVKELNNVIAFDDSLGKGFRIGHSYFCNQNECIDDWMKEVVHYDIIPTLREYWFDDSKKLQEWENRLTGVFDD
ncbi:MAG: AAA family ATPase [Erysipelotrichaceae bacterium]